MCAIAGLISASRERLAAIARMTSLLCHRGPDDEGYLFAGKSDVVPVAGANTPRAVLEHEGPDRPIQSFATAQVPSDVWLALGHRRLSILDLSPLGHQPLSYKGRYWIVYNGEVYNYLELRTELQSEGYAFASHTDTEVILAAYDRWGRECLGRFNGMWAFAIFDQATQNVFLARDRFGVKPLYYWSGPECFAFASEIKAFTCLEGWRSQLNGQAAHDYLLTSLQDHSPETIFDGVFQLGPGCCATIDAHNWNSGGSRNAAQLIQVQPWFTLRPRPFAGNLDDAAAEFQALLTDAVRLRLRADVPVGSCLSGGLDSSSIVCVANRLLRDKEASFAQETFSACAELKRFDERAFIEKVAAATEVRSHYVFPAPEDLFDQLDALIWHQDEPFGSTSIFAQWTVFQLAGQHRIKVMLDGQGADELLYGYPDYRRAFIAGLIRAGKLGTAWNESLALRSRFSGALSLWARGALDAAAPLAIQKRFRRARKNRRPPDWLCRDRLHASFPGRLAQRFHSHATARDLSLAQVTGAHLQMLLHWEDRNSMAHGVESRLPFLDYRMAEFALGLPDEFKIHQGWSKAVLRQGMRGVVPPAVLERRDKMGFVTPEEIWARQSSSARFREALAEAVKASRGVLSEQANTRFSRMVSGELPYDGSIWRMICFGRWLIRFEVSV
jgi:asparagine synthase (glutamine-hydrolysing)